MAKFERTEHSNEMQIKLVTMALSDWELVIETLKQIARWEIPAAFMMDAAKEVLNRLGVDYEKTDG